jgi:hypothetical protein
MFWNLLQLGSFTESRAAQIHALRLIRETSIDTKRRVYITSNTPGLVDALKLLHVITIQ